MKINAFAKFKVNRTAADLPGRGYKRKINRIFKRPEQLSKS